MVETYWNVGKQIYEAQGENKRAEYGAGMLKILSEKLTEEFGQGYTVRNLNNMRAFYIAFPNWNALRANLSWTHYRMLLKVEKCFVIIDLKVGKLTHQDIDRCRCMLIIIHVR